MTNLARRNFLASTAALAVMGLPCGLGAAVEGATSRSAALNVLEFGAIGNGRTKDTAAIQRAIDACARVGGGTVLLPAGHIFLSGTLSLKPFVTLEIESGATLRASPDRDDFRALGALLFALNAANVAITGGGTIDGNFHAFLKDRTAEGYTVTEPFLGPYDPLYTRPGRDHPDGRPRMILLVGCNGARLRDFTIRDAPTWTIHPIGCNDLHVTGITIRNSLEVPNCDGIDIDHCKNVRMDNCDIIAGDDCIVLKASRNFREYGACENITVSNCLLQSSSAAIKIEAEGPDAIRNATFTGCTITDSNRGIAINNRDGAVCENMTFADMEITTSLRPPMWWGAGEPIYVTNMPRTLQTAAGRVRDIHFANIHSVGENGVFLAGYPGQELENISLSNVDVAIAKTSSITGGYYDTRPGELKESAILQRNLAGVYGEHVNGLRLRDVAVQWRGPRQRYYGAPLELHHVRGLQLGGFSPPDPPVKADSTAGAGAQDAYILDDVTRTP